MWRRGQVVQVVAISAGVALALFGCSANTSNAAGCVQGLSSSCVCANGSRGVQVCQADNTFGQCACSPAAPAVGGSGGSAATAPSGTGGGGGGPAIATGGNGSAGVGGRPGGIAGQPNSGGGMGMGVGGAAGQAAPGAAYSFCDASSPCAMGTTCTNMSGGYCSPPCVLALQCPRPSSGGRATCTAGACAVSSCDQLRCPRGMTCMQTSMMTPTGVQTSYGCAK